MISRRGSLKKNVRSQGETEKDDESPRKVEDGGSLAGRR